jgi:hypothetical protein
LSYTEHCWGSFFQWRKPWTYFDVMQ